jgi:hypothetical protein
MTTADDAPVARPLPPGRCCTRPAVLTRRLAHVSVSSARNQRSAYLPRLPAESERPDRTTGWRDDTPNGTKDCGRLRDAVAAGQHKRAGRGPAGGTRRQRCPGFTICDTPEEREDRPHRPALQAPPSRGRADRRRSQRPLRLGYPAGFAADARCRVWVPAHDGASRARTASRSRPWRKSPRSAARTLPRGRQR